MNTPPTYQLFVGIDIAAKTFVAAWTSPQSRDRARTFAQTSEGFAEVQEQLAATGTPPGQTLIVMEAIGSYWIALAVTLHTAG
jgi:transposase